MKPLLIAQTTDPTLQENLRRIEDGVRSEPLVKGQFKFFSFALAAPSYPATVEIPHGLGFVPTEVLETQVSPGATVDWEYALFTNVNLVATLYVATAVRCYVGRYSEGR